MKTTNVIIFQTINRGFNSAINIRVTWINPQQINPLKMRKKEWPTPAEASEVERSKKWPLFGKIRPWKQRKEERFETVEIENYGKNETNNKDQQNEHNIIVPDTQNFLNQVEKNASNFHNR